MKPAMSQNPIKCPKCGLLNPPDAIWCECGYDFTSQQMRQSARKQSSLTKPSLFRWLWGSGGVVLVPLGYALGLKYPLLSIITVAAVLIVCALLPKPKARL
jgi:hypothetical protein